MKRFAGFLAPIVCATILLSGCGSNKLKVKEVNFPDGEIQTQQALVFTFNNNLATDSLFNKWDSTGYLEFHPAVRGSYQWVSANQLSFAPNTGFLPNTDYTVTLTKKLFAHSKKSTSVDETPIKFHTPYLKIENVETFWTTKDGNVALGVFVGVNIDFNYNVSPAAVMQKLKMLQDKTGVTAELISAEEGNQVRLMFIPTNTQTYPSPLQVTLDKGLKCIGSERESDKPLEYTTQVPAKDQFQVISALPVFQGGNSIINVTTTQPVKGELNQYVTLSPTVTNMQIKTLPNGFSISGEFSEKQDYTLTVSGQLENIFGIKLKQEYTGTIHFGNPPPYLAFDDKNSTYLSSQGARNLGLNLIGIPKFKLSIFKVYENNIMHYLRNGRSYGYDNEGDGDNGDNADNGDNNSGGEDEEGYSSRYDYYSYDYAPNPDFGDVISKKEYSSSNLPKKGMMSILNINLSDLQYESSRKGIYLIKVQDSKRPWIQDRKLLIMSDIGVIVKKGINQLTVFCNSLLDANKISGAKVTFLSNNNQEIYTASTDGDGVANFAYDKSKYPGKDVTAVIVKNGNDFTYMDLSENAVNVANFDAGGKTTTSVPYDAFMYSSRDLYRPGDTININSIVRNFDWTVLKDVPVKFKIKMPSGKQLQEMKGTLDAQGSCAIQFYVPYAAMTGSYNVEMYSGNNVLLKTFSFMVEEFMPQRIKVDVQSEMPEYYAGKEAKIFVQAMELFGPPAANKNYQATLDLDFTPFYSKKFDDYDFNITRPSTVSFTQMTDNGQTDENGKATVSFQLPETKNVGLLTGRSIVTVFDETGRPVNKSTSFKVFTQKVFYGIKNFEWWVSTNQPLNLSIAAADKSGNASSGMATVQIIKHTWETVLTRTYSSTRYTSQEKLQTVYIKNMSISGTASFDFTPIESGDYELRISPDGSTEAFVSRRFWAYGSGSTDYNAFQVQKEGNVEIKPDKTNYQTGDKAHLLFTCPFDGKLIVTIEQNSVIEKFFIKTDHKAASLDIPIKKEYLPNIYVGVSEIRELSDNSLPLTIARGFVPLKVDEADNKADVQITCADNSRSKTTQTIKVKTVPNAEVTIAAVDEGVLLITGFQTPDPYTYFYGKRALEVNSYDLYPRVLPELNSLEMSSMAGDEGLEGRLSPEGNKRVHIIAYWSGILKANGSGECSYTVNIPEFSGTLRVMAVAYKDNKFGSAEKKMIVADPIVISTSLPRFMSPNDENTLNVVLSNTTGSKVNAESMLSLSGPLKLVGNASQSIEIPAHGEKTVIYDLNAQPGYGIAKVDIAVKALHETFTDHEEMPVRPPIPMEKLTDGGVIKGGESKSINLTTSYTVDGAKGYITVSRSPLVQFTKNLGSLLEYPYGCMEQTISTAFPVLYYSALVKALGQKETNDRYSPSYIVNEAIKKLYAQQQYNGGLTYWPGEAGVNWWISAYGLHFLLEAKKQGYEVDNTVMENLIQYLSGQVNTKTTYTYKYYDIDNKLQERTIIPEEMFYSLYVLALANRPNIPVMNYLKAQAGPGNPATTLTNQGLLGYTNLLTLDSRYMLAAAYALTGDMKAFSSLLPNGFTGERATRCSEGSFYSYIRDESLSLATLLQAQPDNSQIPVLARHISEELKTYPWLSTQENAWALIALGKYSENALKSTATATISIDGVNAGTLAAGDITAVVHRDISNKKVQVTTSGSGILYYYYETQGIPSGSSFKEEDSYLKVRKGFYTQDGTPIHDLSSIQQEQMIVVDLTISSLDNSYVNNVAITDILPACFEIENPRINPEREMTWIKDKAEPDNMDIRDDRITLFTSVSPTEKHYYYMVRAVAKGKYVMGPVGADAMYDDTYHSYNGAGFVTVK
jgi:uncharacterized protein YfaS (alpha-2-macroglobulin family)